MAKKNGFNDNDGDEAEGMDAKPTSPAKLNVTKGSKTKFGGLSSGLKRKPERGGMAKLNVGKMGGKKKGL